MVPEIVYHYCSVDTFYKIITNHELWLTDVSKSNDYKELVLIFDELEKLLAPNVDQIVSQSFVPLSMYSEFFKEFRKLNLMYHVCCFSEDRDSLSQWAMYAKNATGIAIGFKTRSFISLHNYNENIDFNPISYSIDSAIIDIKRKINSFVDIYTNDPESNNYSWYKKFISYFIDELLKIICLYKNKSFSQEHEYRIAVNSTPCFSDTNGKEISFSHSLIKSPVYLSDNYSIGAMSFFPSNGKLTSYRPLHINNLSTEISEIIIGPKCNVTEHDIKLFLLAYNIYLNDKKIMLSNSTYQ